MNRLTDPIVAHTLSGDALSPCSDAGGTGNPSEGAAQDLTGAEAIPPADAPVDLFSVPAIDAPSDVPLDGLRRMLRGLVADLGPVVQYLTDLTDFEQERIKQHRPTPVELCAWLDGLQHVADGISSHAIGVHHVCDVLWDYASIEASRRREAELEIARDG